MELSQVLSNALDSIGSDIVAHDKEFADIVAHDKEFADVVEIMRRMQDYEKKRDRLQKNYDDVAEMLREERSRKKEHIMATKSLG